MIHLQLLMEVIMARKSGRAALVLSPRQGDDTFWQLPPSGKVAVCLIDCCPRFGLAKESIRRCAGLINLNPAVTPIPQARFEASGWQ